jgi:hypothetical protein
MRALIVLIIILLAVFYFLPEEEPPTAEESFIGDQVKTLRKAEGFESEYLKADQARQQRMEQQLEEATGDDGG